MPELRLGPSFLDLTPAARFAEVELISMISRRKLLSTLPALSAASAFPLAHALESTASAKGGSADKTIPLREGWQFRLDPSASSMPGTNANWQPVIVPHTWQALGGSPDYVGVAWYQRSLLVPSDWRTQFVRVEFEAVYHTAHVFLNDEPVGEHIGKGYTAFTCDLSPHLRYDEANTLTVRVDNSFSNTMLPRLKSFDWANDGGIIRPVQLLVTPPVFVERIAIDAVPDLSAASAQILIRATIRNATPNVQRATLSAGIRASGGTAIESSLVSGQLNLGPNMTQTVPLEGIQIESARLWHFDAPNLYWADVTLQAGDRVHTLNDRFGIRHFEIRGTSFCLNGEPVSLVGVERMAGSNPQFGMAEPSEWIDSNSRDIKDLNCVFTRVHWPQDRRILDFCDEQGMLMQEEVPAWGESTFENLPPELLDDLTENGLAQLHEMVARDRNHPCIVSWGLCNEVNGKNPNSRSFAHAMAKEARASDPLRLLTYASHTLRDDPGADMAGDFDFISANEYFGSWYPGGPEEVLAFLQRIRQAFPDKPIVVSEYGWCECQPIIPPGDENRVKIIEEHTRIFRESGVVAGAIYFDYNDYRTVVGDKGVGALRQRVHGVVDLYADRKPSFDALRRQSSPIEAVTLKAAGDGFTLEIHPRRQLPGYILRGYAVRWLFYGYDDLPMEGSLQPLDPLIPGTSVTMHLRASIPDLKRVRADVLRPTGSSVRTAEVSI